MAVRPFKGCCRAASHLVKLRCALRHEQPFTIGSSRILPTMVSMRSFNWMLADVTAFACKQQRTLKVFLDASAHSQLWTVCTRARSSARCDKVSMSCQWIREGACGSGEKPLGDRAIEPLTAHVSLAYARDRADTLCLVHRSTPDAVVTEASI